MAVRIKLLNEWFNILTFQDNIICKKQITKDISIEKSHNFPSSFLCISGLQHGSAKPHIQPDMVLATILLP